jgi:transposase InsO family protein
MKRLRRQGYSLATVCDFIGISPQAYHKRLKHDKEKGTLYKSLEQIVVENREKKSRAGLRTIYHKEKLNSLLGINQFEQQMSVRGLALKPIRSFIKTTDSRGHHYKFDNLVSGIELNGENQVIVGDITYYRGNGQLYYIFQFQDNYTLEMKGMLGSENMEGVNAERCLKQVFAYNKQRKYNHLLILHTDGGSQYRSHKFQRMLMAAQIRPSHAKNCFENGLSERTNGIVKNEYLIDYDIKSLNQLNAVLTKIKHQINEVWPSRVLGYRTPEQFAQWTRELKTSERPLKLIKTV